jgi:methionyl-tRNA synthetase
VWVHGFLLAAGGERMSKSRGNMLDPNDVVRAFGADGARYIALREVPFDRDADVSWDSMTRRYNADLANDFGNLLNRTLNMTSRYVDRVRVAPRAAPESSLAAAWAETWPRVERSMETYLLHEALAALWEFVGAANRFVEAEQPWQLAKLAKSGDSAAEERLRGVLGDLLEACRVTTLAAAPFIPSAARRATTQLGVEYPYDATGGGGPPLADLLTWGAATDGRIGVAEVLFPRVEALTDSS